MYTQLAKRIKTFYILSQNTTHSCVLMPVYKTTRMMGFFDGNCNALPWVRTMAMNEQMNGKNEA